MSKLLCARVRFRKEGMLHEGWHAIECKHERVAFGVGVEQLVGHVVEALDKLGSSIDNVVSIEIMWATEGSWQWSMVSMLLPDIKEKKHVRRYYTLSEG